MTLAENKAIIRRYYDELWNKWDLSSVDDIIGPEISFRGSLGVAVQGRDGFKNYVVMVRRAFPDFHNTIDELVAEGERVVARLTYHGTHRGECFGISPTGRVVSYAGIALFRIVDGKIVSGWVIGDTSSLLRQLGSARSEKQAEAELPITAPTEYAPAIELRPTAPGDLDFVIRAEEDPDNCPFIIPWKRDQYAAALTDPDFSHLIVEHPASGSMGFVLLAGLANAHESLEFRRIVVTDKRKGIGRLVVRLVKRLAFVQHRAHRLCLDVKQNNHRARRLYESEGFVVEGTLRECLRIEDGYDSLVVMSMLASEYRDAKVGNAGLPHDSR